MIIELAGTLWASVRSDKNPTEMENKAQLIRAREALISTIRLLMNLAKTGAILPGSNHREKMQTMSSSI